MFMQFFASRKGLSKKALAVSSKTLLLDRIYIIYITDIYIYREREQFIKY